MVADPTPLRPAEQVAGGYLVMHLGGKSFEVRVLPARANREWTTQFSTVLDQIVSGIGEPKTLQEVAASVNSYAVTFMDMLIAYDREGVLPERDWIDTHATDGEIYTAIQQVSIAAFPLGNNLLELALMQAAQKVRHSLRSTSSAPPSTAGRPRRSKPKSPTSN